MAMSDSDSTILVPVSLYHQGEDITGKRFGRLLVVGLVVPDKSQSKWLCQCDCGQQKTVHKGNLRRGLSKSCGCLQREIQSKKRKDHGLSHTGEYDAWANMMARCYKPENCAFLHYGGRGITVCERWHAFPPFLEDMGLRPTPKHTLERCNNDMGYSPENCKWATRIEQQNNRRVCRFLEFDGRRMTVSQWSVFKGWARGVIAGRLEAGWSVERALTVIPVSTRRKRLDGAAHDTVTCSDASNR
jgi:hypothetical protein